MCILGWNKLLENFVVFVVDYEIVTSFDENYETRGVSSKFKSATSRFLDYCIIYFIENTYFVDDDKRRIVS
jgi:hypothetical protein